MEKLSTIKFKSFYVLINSITRNLNLTNNKELRIDLKLDVNFSLKPFQRPLASGHCRPKQVLIIPLMSPISFVFLHSKTTSIPLKLIFCIKANKTVFLFCGSWESESLNQVFYNDMFDPCLVVTSIIFWKIVFSRSSLYKMKKKHWLDIHALI